MKRLFLVCLLFLVFSSLHAENKFRFVIGPTVSYFLDAENTKPKVGLAIGVRKDFQLHRKLALSTGANFASRGAVLENRAVRPYASQPTEAFYQDIHGMGGYIELPILIEYEIPITRKFNIKPTLGPAISIPAKDLSHFERREFLDIYVPQQSDPSEYDFSFEQESGFGVSHISIVLNFAIQLQYLRYILEIGYVRDSRETYHFKNLSEVNNRMHSIYFTISF